MSRRRDPIFAQAVARWHYVRAEFEIFRENAYRRANDDLGGVLLNARGKKAGLDPYSLFIGPAARAYAYASEELVEHWQRYPRMTFEQFERQHEASGQEWVA